MRAYYGSSLRIAITRERFSLSTSLFQYFTLVHKKKKKKIGLSDYTNEKDNTYSIQCRIIIIKECRKKKREEKYTKTKLCMYTYFPICSVRSDVFFFIYFLLLLDFILKYCAVELYLYRVQLSKKHFTSIFVLL